VTGAVLALVVVAAHAAAAPRLLQSSAGGVLTRPYGAFLRHDVAVDTGLLPALLGDGPWGDVRVGAFSQWLVYSNEFGGRVSLLTHPELLILSLEGAVDPGLFIHGGELPDPVRTGGLRSRLSAQAVVNVKLDWWWLYSRSTATLRHRDFDEWDPYNGVVLRDEASVEQATALFLKIAPLKALRVDRAKPPALWGYGEYTIGWLFDHGARPNRTSIGLLTEHFPAPDLFIDLDVAYSFAPAPIDGVGVILLYGFLF
jgi:hypothetical protein